jgi:hypothetical protein
VTAWVPDVVAGQTIESAWGNLIRDRTITPFANAAARDAAIPAPVAGMTCYLQSTGELLTYHAGAWRKPWNMPWGHVATVVIGQTLNIPAGAQVVAGSAFSLPVAGRRYGIHCTLEVYPQNFTAITQIVTVSIQPNSGVGAFADVAAQSGGGTGFGDTLAFHLYGTAVAATNGQGGHINVNAFGILSNVNRGQVVVMDVGL